MFFTVFQVGDYKEGFYIGVEVDEDDPESSKPFYGTNKWPAPGKMNQFLFFEKKNLIFIKLIFHFLGFFLFGLM